MKKNLQTLVVGLMLFTALIFSIGTVQAQVYASWNMTGQTGFGTSPIAPTFVSADAVVTENLTRSAGFSTTQGTAPAQTNRWGGRTAAASVSTALGGGGGTLRVFTFAIKPQTGSTLSFGSISPISVWVSSTSPLNYLMQYSTDGTAYTDIITHTITATSQSLRTIPQTDLSSIMALQGVLSTTTIYFRIVPYGGSSSDFNFVYFTAPTNLTSTSGGNANSFAVTGPITLPVKLSSFSSSIQNQAAFLKWTTESEVNFDYFSVEKRDQNSEFREIGRVAAKGGNGKSLYSFSDKNISFETSYYRLKMVDKDGTFEYSDVIDEALTSLNQALSIWPNPAVNQNAKVAFKELSIASTLKVIDLSGRVVINQQLKKGTSNIDLDLSKLNNGQYVLLLESNGAKLDYLKFLKEN
jgi:Secretion system C-terminal sorting domain